MVEKKINLSLLLQKQLMTRNTPQLLVRTIKKEGIESDTRILAFGKNLDKELGACIGALIGVIAGLVVNVLGFLLSNLPSVAQMFCGWKASNRISSLR
ncbi:hypothetical protein [Corynebacterium diphtheriae]|uniref:hypothetical protein n=1 Tax=Corynebacterium diphtheriae TaxID=1717 RepID=UPI0013C72A86|nr:hypothetical protein [Corynebacterium diphtheriae]CAB0914353.1 hypothetical protein FRC0425_01870 [Corynebacterium diphtheriae]